MNKLNARIKELCEEKSLTINDLEKLTGLSVPVIKGIEKGDYKMSDLTIARIAKALEVDFSELLKLKD